MESGRNRGIGCPIPKTLGSCSVGPDTEGLEPGLLGVREEAGPDLQGLREGVGVRTLLSEKGGQEPGPLEGQ